MNDSSNNKKIKTTKGSGLKDLRNETDTLYIRNHEWSLLSLLIKRYPEKTREFLDKFESKNSEN